MSIKYKVHMKKPRSFTDLSDARKAAEEYFQKTGIIVAIEEKKSRNNIPMLND